MIVYVQGYEIGTSMSKTKSEWEEFFEVNPSRKKLCGSSDYFLALPSVGQVYMLYCRKSKEWYGIDPRTRPIQMHIGILRQVHDFCKHYGISDALLIVNMLFSPAREGRWDGMILAQSIFAKENRRKIADKLLKLARGE